MNITNQNVPLELLVEKAIANDGAALHSLCEKLGKSVLFRVKYALGSNMNQMDAEDISQEVLIRMCEKIHNLKNAKAFNGWLNSIITNETNRYTKNLTENGNVCNIDEYLDVVLENNVDFIPEDCVEKVEKDEFSQKLMDIVLSLPTRQRRTVIHYYYGELTVSEIAEIMNITHQGVSKNLALARENIKSALKRTPIHKTHWRYARFVN